MAFLKIINDRSGTDSAFALGLATIRAGRSSSNQLRLEDSAASREHFELEPRGDSWVIRDLGSRNGTLINGQLLSCESELHTGDEITVGRTRLIFGDGAIDDIVAENPADSATVMFQAEKLSSSYIASLESRVDEQSRRDMVMLNELSRDILGTVDESSLLEQLVTRVRDALSVDRCAVIYRAGEDSDEVEVKAVAGPGGPEVKISTTAVRSVLEDRMALLITDVSMDDRFAEQQSILDASITSILCAPLLHADSVFGLVYLDSTGQPGTFDKDNLALLSAITNLVAIKIDNLRLVEESINQARMERELALAAEIQSTMLPQAPFTFPGVRSIGFNQPCYEVGGDYFDFMPLKAGGFAVTVADVSGKGASGAILMASCKSMLTAQIDAGVPLVDRVRKLNRFVKDNSTANKFITFFQAEINPESTTMRYVNAGHNPPMVLGASGELTMLTATGPVLGLLDLPHSVQEVSFDPGDVLLAYSDGVTEATDPADEEYEEERLQAIFTSCGRLEPEALRDTILEDVHRFTGGAPQTDDVTLVIVARDD